MCHYCTAVFCACCHYLQSLKLLVKITELLSIHLIVRLLRTHAEVRVGQSCRKVPAEAAPTFTAQHIRRRGTAEGLKSLPAHLHTELSFHLDNTIYHIDTADTAATKDCFHETFICQSFTFTDLLVRL